MPAATEPASKVAKRTRHAMNLRDFPDDLNRVLRAEAAKGGRTLRQYVINLLRKRAYILRAIGEVGLMEVDDDGPA